MLRKRRTVVYSIKSHTVGFSAIRIADFMWFFSPCMLGVLWTDLCQRVTFGFEPITAGRNVVDFIGLDVNVSAHGCSTKSKITRVR